MSCLAELLAVAVIHIEQQASDNPDQDIKVMESIAAGLAALAEDDREAFLQSLRAQGAEQLIDGLGLA